MDFTPSHASYFSTGTVPERRARPEAINGAKSAIAKPGKAAAPSRSPHDVPAVASRGDQQGGLLHVQTPQANVSRHRGGGSGGRACRARNQHGKSGRDGSPAVIGGAVLHNRGGAPSPIRR